MNQCLTVEQELHIAGYEASYSENLIAAFSVQINLGQDLSGSLQGAGGIGGLLSVTRNGVVYFPAADANGNITDYVDVSGAVVAHREFDAYGNTLVATGAMVNEFHFWFSSKYLDGETGLYQWYLRYYDPVTGRWLTKDLIEEKGGNNLYGWCENDGVDQIDIIGLDAFALPDPWTSWTTGNNQPPSSFGYNVPTPSLPSSTPYTFTLPSCNSSCVGTRGVVEITEFKAYNRGVLLWNLDFNWLRQQTTQIEFLALRNVSPSPINRLNVGRRINVALLLIKFSISRAIGGGGLAPAATAPYAIYLNMFGQGNATALANLIASLRRGTAFDLPRLALEYRCSKCECDESIFGTKTYSWKNDNDLKEYRCPGTIAGGLFADIDEMTEPSVYYSCANQFLNDAQTELAGRTPTQPICGK